MWNWRLLGLCLLIAGCGGSENASLAERHELRAQAQAWESRIPTVVFPDQGPSCTPLIVKFTVTSGPMGLPEKLSPATVSLGKNGSVAWSQGASTSETRQLDARTLEGTASACTTPAFAVGDTLDVKVLVRTEFEAAELPASVQLTAAY